MPCHASAVAASFDRFADVAVFVETNGDANLGMVRDDSSRYLSRLWGVSVQAVDGAPSGAHAATIWISSSDAAHEKAGFSGGSGYALKRIDDASGTTLVVTAADADDLAYGAYALLETLGVRFFHPMQELVPQLDAPRLPHTLDVQRRPWTKDRGIQPHLLHPIEYLQTFMVPSDQSLAEAKRLVDWLVKTGQNELQLPLLDSIDFEAWRPHMQAIVDYAHSRGVKIGAVVQLWGGSSLQNNIALVKHADTALSEIDAQLDRVMEIDWDLIDLSMGEFTSTDPQAVIDWLNHVVQHMTATHPSVEVNVQNHVGNYPQLYVQYMGQTVFYYHLPQFADARLGQSVHTVSLFDMYRNWATYGHPDFHLQHDYLFQELPTRRVRYWPEQAYWIGADDDVPLFLPEFWYSRWNDIHSLAAEIEAGGLPPLEGHIEFSSGHEWSYWLTDYLTAKMLWRPSENLPVFVADFASAFGECAPDVANALDAFVDLQNQYVFDDRLLAYLQGENAQTEYGNIAGLETHPRRVPFENVLAMNDADRAGFERDVVQNLEAFAQKTQPIEDTIAARCRGADEALAPWCDELWDGVKIDRLRAEHAAHLYRAVLARAAGSDPEPDFSAALSRTSEARDVVTRREAHYRFDEQRIDGLYDNPTIYPFGYLHEVHTLCYWTRREEQVRYLLDNGVAEGLVGLSGCQGE